MHTRKKIAEDNFHSPSTQEPLLNIEDQWWNKRTLNYSLKSIRGNLRPNPPPFLVTHNTYHNCVHNSDHRSQKYISKQKHDRTFDSTYLDNICKHELLFEHLSNKPFLPLFGQNLTKEAFTKPDPGTAYPDPNKTHCVEDYNTHLIVEDRRSLYK